MCRMYKFGEELLVMALLRFKSSANDSFKSDIFHAYTAHYDHIEHRRINIKHTTSLSFQIIVLVISDVHRDEPEYKRR